ncbi:MAG: family transporter YdiK [Verrucomicrobiota bacterium]|jgi:predicted PurR-regulated permease PerM
MTDLKSSDFIAKIFGLSLIVLLLGGCLYLLRPFLPAFIWAALIVTATWPLKEKLDARFPSKPWFGTAVLVSGMALILIIPCLLTIGAIAMNYETIVEWFRNVKTMEIPLPPDWLEKIPGAGNKLKEYWMQAHADRGQELIQKVTPYATGLVKWLGSSLGGIGLIVLHLLLTLVISSILYSHGKVCAKGSVAFFRRLAGDRGDHCLQLAAKAVRGVALGVVLTALCQTLMASIGLAIIQVDLTVGLILSGLIFMLCIAQIGPGLVLIPVCIWMFVKGDQHIAFSVVMSVWFGVVMLIDNFLRPWLINREANMPLIMVFPGVIGGLFAFGIIGLFIGPVLLAVTWTLLRDWTLGTPSKAPESA